jgi:PAS domain S-box-containing protein
MHQPTPGRWRAFLSGGGELGRLIESHDWAATALGPIDLWPQWLRSPVALMLRSSVPMVMLWGPQGVMIYNDAYSGFAGGRHPQLLGSRVREGWPEVADFNDNVMKVGLAGDTLSYRDQELTLFRSGQAEQVWMDLDYSPLLDDEGKPAGVLAIVTETTAKVRAERRVGGERERMRQMFEQAPGFMAVLAGPEHVFDLVNPAYQQLVGHRDVVGKPVRQALPEVHGQGFFELLDKVYASGETFSGGALTVLLQREPGGPMEQRFMDLVYQPLRADDGSVTGIFVQGTDVTDRLQAERALRDSEALFRTFSQAMPNHVWAATPEGQLHWFNQQCYDYSGFAEGELDGRGWVSMLHPDDVETATRRWAAALAEGRPYEAEFRLRRADGEYRWHLGRALPIRDEAGQVTRWIGTNTDIEDQKASAQALAHLNATLEQQVAERTADRNRMWRLSTDIMLVADFDARIVSVNPAWTTLLGWSSTELIGRKFMDLVHPEDLPATLAELGRLAQGATTFRFENRYQCKDGGYRVLSWTAVPDDRFLHAVGRDVTADHEAAQALRRTEAALHQAQKMESVGQLTGGVAHDFNNLLQVIGGNLQLLAKDVAGHERAEARVASALTGVNRGAKLASQLLAFARRQPLEPKVVNIGRFVSGMGDMLRRTLGESVEVETVVSGGLWNTFADPAQVENAVLNLAINARDAMDGAGKLTIELGNAHLDEAYVRSHPDAAPGQYVMLAVTDTGAGMSPETAARAFEPFFSTKPEGKGTGLGLSMVYGFVKQSGGHVKIDSELGQGTTVKLYLPRTLAAPDVVHAVDTRPVTGGTETILVAEDDDEVRATVVAMLSELGYKVLKAHDAASALAVIESGAAIDLLFTDVVMPGPLRSPELARKARERLPRLAVLFTSGYTEDAIVHGGRLDPGVELLGKPYSQEAMARKIRHVLANRAQRDLGREQLAAGLGAGLPAASAKPVRVLLVEDDPDIRESTAELIRGLGYEVVEAADATSALAALDASPFDILMTDIGLPDVPGDVLARHARERRPAIGIVFASGTDAVTLPERACLLLKPFDWEAMAAGLLKVGPAPG